MRVEKYQQKGKIDAERLLGELKRANRMPKVAVPQSIIFYFSATRNPKWSSGFSSNVDGHNFFGAKLDVICKNKIGVLSGFGIGAPAMAFYFELLVAMGAKSILALGQAGAISAERKIGDMVLVSKAYRDEGTSMHYLPPSEYSYPSVTFTKSLKSNLEKLKLNYVEAGVWSTDALFRETEGEIDFYSKQGLQAVDMETSAVFALGHVLKVETASLLIVSDLLRSPQWSSDFAAARAKMQTVAEAIIALRCEL